MRLFVSFVGLWLAAITGASGADLVVHGAMDLSAMDHVLAGFSEANPSIEVRYQEWNTNDLYEEFLAAAKEGRPTADVLLSSAMDLQTKLANDGYAIAYQSPHKAFLPDWAVWPNEAFAFSFEPLVIL